MTSMTVLPFGRPLTRADLQDLPDDGHRYELIDGTLLVSPAPRWQHQLVLGRLHLLLSGACPPDLCVVFAPFAVALADDTEVQPDLLVAPRSQFTDKELPGPPLLALEVLSPSTRRVDLLLKRDRLQSAGVPSYWIVDPDELSITVLELRDGTYEEVAVIQGGQRHTLVLPFPITLAGDDLQV
jgi:Uma2 family endonuclease